MAEEKRRSVKVSLSFAEDLEDVFNYGVETFGLRQQRIMKLKFGT